MVDLYEKVPSYMILGHPDQKLIFRDGARRHFEFGPLAKNPGIFARDLGAKSFLKGPKRSNQSSKHCCRRMVTELHFVTLLIGLCFRAYVVGVM